jgi:DNA invertase Pin-like site-specific DNA recombinase
LLKRSFDSKTVRSRFQRAGLSRFPLKPTFENDSAVPSEGKYKGRALTARAKSDEVLRLLQSGVRPTDVAKQLGIGRRSVYRIVDGAKA